MISLAWSLVTAAAFVASGFLLREGAFRAAGLAFVVAWLWMTFPKIPCWAMKKIGGWLHGRRAAQA